MKKKILFAYPELFTGGSTTSLISLLNSIDYNKYDVDLILYRKQGEFLKYIPKKVNLIGGTSKHDKNTYIGKIAFLHRYLLKGYFVQALWHEIRYKNKIGLNVQILSKIAAAESLKIKNKYDVAVGFLEYWANDYVLDYVHADIKIAWIHTDYVKAQFIPNIDSEAFGKANKIVCVSQECLNSFKNTFPLLADKSICIHNIISSELLLNKANEKISDFDTDFDGLKIITVSRLSIHTKGFDRIITAVKNLVRDGYDLRWYIVGDGADKSKIEKMIKFNDLTEKIILLGNKINPFPYLKKCDVFAMPSRYEGKPMAVTEAQIMDLPIVVTNYSSAKEQVQHGIDGLIVENNDDSIYYGIKEFLDNPQLLFNFKMNLQDRHFSNEDEINEFYSILK